MKWTEQQLEAIVLRGKNMLVSAAAGSGKTAVLVERIKQLIIADRISIDRLLVVTFTNAAAAEMKEKIIKAITLQIEESPEASYFLRKQLNIIYKANISTFHAFAMEIIRRYFYIINVDPNFKICDEAQAIILRGEAMDQLFEELFDSYRQDFIEFLEKYSVGKNENSIREMILHTYLTMQSVPEPWEWFDDNVEKLKDSKEMFLSGQVFAVIKAQIDRNLNYALRCCSNVRQMLSEHGVLGLEAKCIKEIAALEELVKSLETDDFENFIKKINSFQSERYVAKKDEKEAYEEIKEGVKFLRDKGSDKLKEIKAMYSARGVDEYVEDIQSTYESVKFLGTMVKRFSELYGEVKTEKNLIDFSDIEHFALKILKNDQVASEYRDKFDYIFVDEYQDSNLIQETLINKISRENNLFMVGDVKQSIYKFRLAEPEIFMDKYEKYKMNTKGKDAKIDLNMNFRSKGKIIEKTNLAFESLMDGYDSDAALYKGVEYCGPLDFEPELHIVDCKLAENLELSEEIKELKKGELEALAAVEIIREAVGKPVFDAKKGVERPLCKKDIVILMRSTKGYAGQFQKIFTDNNIPAHIAEGEGYFDTLEIEIFLNLLRIIDNKKQDIPLLSVLYSMVFDYSAEELIQVRIEGRGLDFSTALSRYSQQGSVEPLKEKCRAALNAISQWQSLSKSMPLEELLWHLMWETGYYTYNGALPAGEQRQANLRALVDRAVKFSEMQMSGLYSFISYIESVKARGVQIGQVSLTSENDDVVRIMTIHKSKGLEYPMVIVAGLGKKFNYGSDAKKVSIHKDLGIGLKRVYPKEHWYRKTLVQNAIACRISEESLEEEIRVMYVAFTRAMDRLVLLGSVNDLEKTLEKYQLQGAADKYSASAYLDLLVPVLKDNLIVKYHNRSFAQGMSEKREDRREALRNILGGQALSGQNQDIELLIDKRLSFEYKYKDELTRKSKYTVTELNRSEQSEFKPGLAVPRFAQGEKALTGAEKGTILHTAMEHLDFAAGGEAYGQGLDWGRRWLKQFLNKLQQDSVLLPEECAAVKTSAIEKFLQSEIGKRAANAAKLYKELPFNLLMDVEGTQVMVQGSIDCCFMEADGRYVILDYKSNYMENGGPEEIQRLSGIYENQLRIYKEAFEVIKGVKVKECHLYLFSSNMDVLVV